MTIEVEEENKGLYDAIDAAITEVSPQQENTDDENESDDAVGESGGSGESDDDAGDDQSAAATGDGDSADADAENEGDEEDAPGGDAAAAESGADDGEAGEDEGDDGAETGTGKAGDDEGKGDEPVGAPDPVNDPIPASLKKETQERIKSLIGIAKEAQTHTQQRDEIVSRITETGATPEQYANTLGFLKLYNSDNVEERKTALQVARGIVRELSVELGEGSADLLASHDDLKADIEAGTITEARAVEIATAREKTKLANDRKAAKDETETQQQTMNRLLEQGKTDLNNLEEVLKASPEYTELRPKYVAILKPILKRTHPSEWGTVARETYAAVKANFTPAPVTTPTTTTPPKNQPLRAKQGAGGGTGKKSEVKSALEAIDAAILGM